MVDRLPPSDTPRSALQDRHSDWLRSSAKLAVRQRAAGWKQALTWKPLAKLTAAVNYLARGSDCMMAVAERPAV